MYVYVPSLFGAEHLFVVFQLHGAGVVPICNGGNLISLTLEEIFNSGHTWQRVINANKLCFSGAFCVDLLLLGGCITCACA